MHNVMIQRTALSRSILASASKSCLSIRCRRSIHVSTLHHDSPSSKSVPANKNPDRLIEDDYNEIRSKYATPKYPIVLAHGLFGFDELRILGPWFPGVKYWRGITEVLTANGIEVIIASVPPSASIEDRAAALSEVIERKAGGKSVNIIAHSMGGLDSRYMISRLHPPNVDVKSLTTISSPHRGSAYADYVLDTIGPKRLPKIYNILTTMGLQTGAFSQLTTKFALDEFNPSTPDSQSVKYFSYGATLESPSLFSSFRHPHKVVAEKEGENDGLVSVESAHWGEYKGTLANVSHLDLIGWTHKVRRVLGLAGRFNAMAFYLDISDMLAKEGF